MGYVQCPSTGRRMTARLEADLTVDVGGGTPSTANRATEADCSISPITSKASWQPLLMDSGKGAKASSPSSPQDTVKAAWHTSSLFGSAPATPTPASPPAPSSSSNSPSKAATAAWASSAPSTSPKAKLPTTPTTAREPNPPSPPDQPRLPSSLRRPVTGSPGRLSLTIEAPTSPASCPTSPGAPPQHPHHRVTSRRASLDLSGMMSGLLGSGSLGHSNLRPTPLSGTSAGPCVQPPGACRQEHADHGALMPSSSHRFSQVGRLAQSCRFSLDVTTLGPSAESSPPSVASPRADVPGYGLGTPSRTVSGVNSGLTGAAGSKPRRKSAVISRVGASLIAECDFLDKNYACAPGVVPRAMQPLNKIFSEEERALHPTAVDALRPTTAHTFSAAACTTHARALTRQSSTNSVQHMAAASSPGASHSQLGALADTAAPLSRKSMPAAGAGQGRVTSYTDKLLGLFKTLTGENDAL